MLVRETRQRLELSQVKFAEALGVFFQTVNHWENRRTQSLPIASQQSEHLLSQMEERGKDLLIKHFSE